MASALSPAFLIAAAAPAPRRGICAGSGAERTAIAVSQLICRRMDRMDCETFAQQCKDPATAPNVPRLSPPMNLIECTLLPIIAPPRLKALGLRQNIPLPANPVTWKPRHHGHDGLLRHSSWNKFAIVESIRATTNIMLDKIWPAPLIGQRFHCSLFSAPALIMAGASGLSIRK